MSKEMKLTDDQLLEIVQSVCIEVSPDDAYVDLELETYINGTMYLVYIDAGIYTNVSLDTPEDVYWPAEYTIELDTIDIQSITIIDNYEEYILSEELLEKSKLHLVNTLIYI